MFSPPGGQRRGGVAIGDSIVDIVAALGAGVLDGAACTAAELAAGLALNPLLALLAAGVGPRTALRHCILEVLADPAFASLVHVCCMMHGRAGCPYWLRSATLPTSSPVSTT